MRCLTFFCNYFVLKISELFHRVILLSGSSLSPWSFQRHAKSNVRKLAQFFSCHGEKSGFPGNSGTSSSSSSTVRNQGAGLNPGFGGGAGVSGGARSASSNTDRDGGPCLRQIPLDQLLAAVNTELLHPRFVARFGPLIDNSVRDETSFVLAFNNNDYIY